METMGTIEAIGNEERDRERGAVVRWLLKSAEEESDHKGAIALTWAAGKIKLGEHRQDEETDRC